MTSQMPRLTAIGLLTLTIATGAAQAAPRDNQRQQSSRVETIHWVSVLRHWLVVATQHLVPTGSSVTPILAKEGSQLDPNGLH
jgi:hypothetical protein